jgi:hypothetical protein
MTVFVGRETIDNGPVNPCEAGYCSRRRQGTDNGCTNRLRGFDSYSIVKSSVLWRRPSAPVINIRTLFS